MAEHGIVFIDGKKCKAGLKPVRDLRCFQILGGNLTMDDGSTVEVGRAKQKALERMLARVDRPVVFCRFLPELTDVENILVQDFDNVKTLSGSIKDKGKNKHRTQLLEDFQSKKIGALAVQSRTGGVSIEFSSTHELVFYSMGYSYIDFQQIIARCRRYGQEKRVKVFLIIVRNTIDEEPLQRIMEKRENVNPIMDHIKEHSMAEAKKAAAKKAAPKAAKKAAPEKRDGVGIEYIADKLDISESAARLRLRNAEIDKDGRSYWWDTKTKADAVVKKLEAAQAG
jgi:ERCC4-related helicase